MSTKECDRVQVGSVWRSKVNGRLAKVVNIYPSMENGSLVAAVHYDNGDGFRPSILPSTWAIKHWDERFEPAQPKGGDDSE